MSRQRIKLNNPCKYALFGGKRMMKTPNPRLDAMRHITMRKINETRNAIAICNAEELQRYREDLVVLSRCLRKLEDATYGYEDVWRRWNPKEGRCISFQMFIRGQECQ